MAELHRARCTTTGDGTQSGYITEHLCQWYLRLDDTCTRAAGVHTLYLTTTFVQVTDDVTHALFRCYHLDLHDRLHQLRFSLSRSLFERHLCSDLEGQLVRVYRVEATVEQRYLQAIQRITGEHTVLHSDLEALLYTRDVLLRHVTTLDNVFELKTTREVSVCRLNANDDVSELTTTTGLFLINLTQLNRSTDSLTVSHLRTTLVTLYLELTFQTVDDDLQVELTHTRDNGLTRLLVGLNGERRVLFGQLSETNTQFVEVCLALRLNGDTDHRCRELDRLQYDRLVLVAQRIARAYILKSYARAYIACENSLNRILVVRVHLEDTGDTLFLTRTRVVNV